MDNIFRGRFLPFGYNVPTTLEECLTWQVALQWLADNLKKTMQAVEEIDPSVLPDVSGLKEQIEELQQKVNQQQTALTEAIGDIDTIKEADYQEQIDQIKEALDDLDPSSGVSFDNVPVEGSQNAVRSGGLFSQFSQVNTAITGIQSTLDTLEQTVEGNTETITQLNQSLQGAISSITAINGEIDDIQSDYLTKAGAAEAYATKEELQNVADNIHDLTGYETTQHAAATYETKENAAASYETKTNAAATYETKENAAATYETTQHAAATYATKQEIPDVTGYETTQHAAATYETKENAAATYATKQEIPDVTGYETAQHAAATYETKENAASTYATKQEIPDVSGYETAQHASDTYETKANASATYATKQQLDGVSASIPDVSGYETAQHASETYETKANASATYATKQEIPDVTGYETTQHAAATYETKENAASTYATKQEIPDVSGYETTQHAAATYETKENAASTYATKQEIPDVSEKQDQIGGSFTFYAYKGPGDDPMNPDLEEQTYTEDIDPEVFSLTYGKNMLDGQNTIMYGSTLYNSTPIRDTMGSGMEGNVESEEINEEVSVDIYGVNDPGYSTVDDTNVITTPSMKIPTVGYILKMLATLQYAPLPYTKKILERYFGPAISGRMTYSVDGDNIMEIYDYSKLLGSSTLSPYYGYCDGTEDTLLGDDTYVNNLLTSLVNDAENESLVTIEDGENRGSWPSMFAYGGGFPSYRMFAGITRALNLKIEELTNRSTPYKSATFKGGTTDELIKFCCENHMSDIILPLFGEFYFHGRTGSNDDLGKVYKMGRPSGSSPILSYGGTFFIKGFTTMPNGFLGTGKYLHIKIAYVHTGTLTAGSDQCYVFIELTPRIQMYQGSTFITLEDISQQNSTNVWELGQTLYCPYKTFIINYTEGGIAESYETEFRYIQRCRQKLMLHDNTVDGEAIPWVWNSETETATLENGFNLFWEDVEGNTITYPSSAIYYL